MIDRASPSAAVRLSNVRRALLRADHAPCPVCKGSGHLSISRRVTRDRTKERRAMAKVLRANGYSIRQIADLLGWKSPRSVQLALEQ